MALLQRCRRLENESAEWSERVMMVAVGVVLDPNKNKS